GRTRCERLRVIQDGKTFRFVQNDYSYSTPMEGQQLTGLFALRANSGFDPLKPWRLEILINSAGSPPVTVVFGLDYKIPDTYVLQVPGPPVVTPAPQQHPQPDPEPEPEPPPPVATWVEAWSDARVDVVILAVLLSVLTLIFILPGTLARS